jgi:SAM-dependent methyltransferase
MTLNPKDDPLGQAIYNYYTKKDNSSVTVYSKVVEDEELPPEYFFRNFDDMPMLERIALKKCKGKVLDVGAGAGCHSLYLQSQKKHVTALEASGLCCEIMKMQGIKHVVHSDIINFNGDGFDTILLLMNGVGIAGTIQGLSSLLSHLKSLLNEGGKILLDSSDLIYLFEQEDGSFVLDINAENYYGEIDYQLSYKKIIGQSFSWLFADSVILQDVAAQCGLKTKIIEYGPHYDYLAELSLD